MLDNGFSYETCIIISGATLILSAIVSMMAAIGRYKFNEDIVHPMVQASSRIQKQPSINDINCLDYSQEDVSLRMVGNCGESDDNG
ncbi:hypothetical protein ScPMuIL_018554 [Solemya velum]